MRRWVFVLGITFALMLSACGDDNNPAGPDNNNNNNNNNNATPFTFTEIQDDVFSASCAFSGCHSSGSKMAGLDLSLGNAYANLVNVAATQNSGLMRVEPGDSENSYLIHKLNGTGAQARMPRGQSALPQETIDRIKAWIDDGAENN